MITPSLSLIVTLSLTKGSSKYKALYKYSDCSKAQCFLFLDKILGLKERQVEEWADFLEEEGIISIEYKFTKPYLVARKLAKKDVQERAKEFSGKKEGFVRKAEVSLSFLNKESNKLNSLKQEFEKIKQELGLDIGSIKNELEELKKYPEFQGND